jgi:hypothetical protein
VRVSFTWRLCSTVGADDGTLQHIRDSDYMRTGSVHDLVAGARCAVHYVSHRYAPGRKGVIVYLWTQYYGEFRMLYDN